MASERVTFTGAAGNIEVFVDRPAATPRGIALIGHPHPLYGGTAENKVAQTLAKTFAELGYIALRPNFRGVGNSQGTYDRGIGETEDMIAVTEQARAQYGDLPIVLAGFSFGAYVQTRVGQRIVPERMVLVAPATGRMSDERDYDTQAVPADTIVIHGEKDETVPLANALDWARPQELPIIVVPGAEHFFHRRLHILKNLIQGAWRS
jgi:alpha/beta superfamily hydrolase